MAVQIPIDPDAVTGTECDDGSVEVTGDLSYRRLSIVNVMFFGPPGAGDQGWVLIDAGVMGSKGTIAEIAERRFGRGARPAAIVMTHGHFDHLGDTVAISQRRIEPSDGSRRQTTSLCQLSAAWGLSAVLSKI